MSISTLPSLRFGPERGMLDDLLENFGLRDLIEHIIASDRLAPYHQLVLAQQLRLTPLIAPRVFRLFESVRLRLGFTDAVDLFVFPHGTINAISLTRLKPEQPHVISVTSEAIRTMGDHELMFVLGHEIGHLGFGHARIMVVSSILDDDDDDEKGGSRGGGRIPPLLQRRLEKWRRLSELSADRAGLLACGGDVGSAISAFFRMASGLGPDDLNFDPAAFLHQLEDLRRMSRKEVLSAFSHPATPVRARALQRWNDAGAEAAPGADLEAVDAEVMELASLMDFEATGDFAERAREVLLCGGMLAAASDGEITQEERETLVALLLQVTGDPEQHLASVNSRAEAEQRLAVATEWLRTNAGTERFALFGQLVHIVARDGRLDEAEQRFMLGLAASLDIPDRSAKEILHEVLASYVRERKSAGQSWGIGFAGG